MRGRERNGRWSDGRKVSKGSRKGWKCNCGEFFSRKVSYERHKCALKDDEEAEKVSKKCPTPSPARLLSSSAIAPRRSMGQTGGACSDAALPAVCSSFQVNPLSLLASRSTTMPSSCGDASAACSPDPGPHNGKRKVHDEESPQHKSLRLSGEGVQVDVKEPREDAKSEHHREGNPSGGGGDEDGDVNEYEYHEEVYFEEEDYLGDGYIEASISPSPTPLRQQPQVSSSPSYTAGVSATPKSGRGHPSFARDQAGRPLPPPAAAFVSPRSSSADRSRDAISKGKDRATQQSHAGDSAAHPSPSATPRGDVVQLGSSAGVRQSPNGGDSAARWSASATLRSEVAQLGSSPGARQPPNGGDSAARWSASATPRGEVAQLGSSAGARQPPSGGDSAGRPSPSATPRGEVAQLGSSVGASRPSSGGDSAARPSPSATQRGEVVQLESSGGARQPPKGCDSAARWSASATPRGEVARLGSSAGARQPPTGGDSAGRRSPSATPRGEVAQLGSSAGASRPSNGGNSAASPSSSATPRGEVTQLGSSAGVSRGGRGLESHRPPPAHSSTIHSDMAVDELWDTIRGTVVSERKLFALFGLILAEQPAHVKEIIECRSQAPPTAKTSSSKTHEPGSVAALMAPFSFAMVGVAKKQFSNNEKDCNATNNAFFAAARQLSKGTVDADETSFLGTLTTLRSELHSVLREGLVRIFITPLLQTTWNGDAELKTITQLSRATRDAVLDLNADDERMKQFMNVALEKVMKAHRGENRGHLTPSDVFGPIDLLEDFAEEVTFPLLKTAISDIQFWEDPESQGKGSACMVMLRKAEVWAHLSPEGHESNSSHVTFQNELWQGLFSFCTGKRRRAHNLLAIANADEIRDTDLCAYVRPYLYESGKAPCREGEWNPGPTPYTTP